jgi:hypothetical protein
MRTRIATFASALALAIAAMPGVALSGANGNGIQCVQPGTEIVHPSPGLCVKAVGLAMDTGFKGPGQAAQYFTAAGGAGFPEGYMDNGRITAGELIHLNCPPELWR